MAHSDRSSRRAWIFLLVLVLCGGLSVLHHYSERTHGRYPVAGFVRDAALVPAAELTMAVGRWWELHIASLFDGPRLARHNAALTAQIAALTLENQRLAAAQVENSSLRHLLDFQQRSNRDPLAAEVVALKPSTEIDTLVVARGARDGVASQAAALGPNGALAGQVLDSSRYSSSVLLLTDDASSVGAQVVRSGKAGPVGICQGNREGPLQLIDLPRDADVRAGDFVSTSGLGGVFPKGIPIGTVLSVKLDRTRSLKTAQVKPAVDFDHLADVFLIISPKTLGGQTPEATSP